MLGLLAAAIFGVAYVGDSISKSCRDADSGARHVEDGKPYYTTSDNNYIYIPTGEKCYITTERTDTAGSYRTVLRTISKGDRHLSRVVYVFPEKSNKEKAAEFNRYYYDGLKKYGLEDRF